MRKYDNDPWAFGFDLKAIEIGKELEEEKEEEIKEKYGVKDQEIEHMKDQDVGQYAKAKRKQMRRKYNA